MLKILGAALVVGVCTICGLTIANNYRQRSLELRNLRSVLNLLETEIVYTATPLPFALEKIAKHAISPINKLFDNARNQLISGNGITADEAWQEAINSFQLFCCLAEEDIGIIRSFGAGLGCSDKTEQLKNIQLTKELLKQQEIKAEMNRNQHERLWRTMGVLVGLGIVLLIY